MCEWNLNSLYEGFESPAFTGDSTALLRLARDLGEMESAFPRERDPERGIRAYLEKLEAFEGLYQKLYAYASFRFSAATNDEEAGQHMVRLREIHASTARVRAAFSAFLSEPEARRLVEQDSFGAYTWYLKDLLAQRVHALSGEGEDMLSALRVTGSQAWRSLHARAAAGEGSEDLVPIAAAALNAIKGEALTVCRLRGYSSPLQEALEKSHFDPRILENQIAAVERYLPRLQTYFSAKAKAMGYPDGLPYEERERLMIASDRKFSFADAKAIILDAFEAFGPRMRRFGEAFFERGWIDGAVRPHKETGASCDAVWQAGESRIRMQYRGTPADATCLAHELGHGYHFENLFGQPVLNCRYDLAVVEVASKFSELLFKEQLCKVLPEEEQLFCEEFILSGCINTIVDIAARFYFEESLFAERQNGELSVEVLDDLMEQAQQRSYADTLDPARRSTRSWVTKPHYYDAQRNFYNFPYQFGTLLSLQMVEKWKQDPVAFAQAYDRFLASTGRYDVLELCRILDMDLLAPDFFEAPLQSLCDRLDRFLERLELQWTHEV